MDKMSMVLVLYATDRKSPMIGTFNLIKYISGISRNRRYPNIIIYASYIRFYRAFFYRSPIRRPPRCIPKARVNIIIRT